MSWSVLRTEIAYQKAINRALAIFQANEDPEADELALLLVLIKDYEDKHIQITGSISD